VKVLLVNPPFDPEESVGESSSVRFVLNITPPLGLAYLGAVLERAGYAVKIADYTSRAPLPPLPELAADFSQDLVGITATTPSFGSARRAAVAVREALPKTLLVLGGAQATACPRESLEKSGFDAVIVGEGEETVLDLAAAAEAGAWTERRAEIAGIAYRDAEGVRVNERRPYIRDLDSLPLPALHLLPPLETYHPTPASYRRLPVGIVMTSRGCPNRCTFCDRAIFGNATRFHSPNRVLEEIDRLVTRFGAREIRFFDDTFTLHRQRTLEICRGLREAGRRLPWTCLTAVRAVTPDLLKEMSRSGCWQVLFGLESGDDRMLRLLGKGNTVELNRKAVRWAQEAGLEVRGDFIVGTPGETMESLENTLRFAIESKLDYAHFNKFTPFPGTELFRRLHAEGYSFDFDRGCSILDHGALLYVPPGLDETDYRAWLDRAFKRFYLRPAHIARRLRAVRTWPQLRGQVRGAASIIGL